MGKNNKSLDQELKEIKIIINSALSRILSLKTKRTYQQELQFISKTIQDYINITYVTKVSHETSLLEQLFKLINILKDSKIVRYKDNYNKYREQGFKNAIKILEQISLGGDKK